MDYVRFAVVAASAAVLCAALTPLFARLAERYRLVAAPRADRWHGRPTPLLGGAGIALAALAVLAVVVPATQASLVVLGAGALAFALGLLDDFRHMAATTKLVGQTVVASALAFGGVQVEIVPSAPFAFVLTVLWVVVIMNAVNLLDNMDGLAAGISAIAALVLGATALATNSGAALIAGATAGAAAGFLVHNFSPARVFMGDAGSHFLGFMLAAVALLHTASGAADVGLAVLGPLAVLALPIFDTAFVAASRRLAGRPISQGGRDHVSHRLALLGLSDRATVLVLYGVAVTLAAVGVVADLISTLVAPLFALSVVGLVLFAIFLAEVDVYGRRRHTEASPVRRALSVYGRFGGEVALDVVLLTSAYYLAYAIRFEGLHQTAWLYLFVASLPLVVSAQLAALVVFGAYRTLWRYLNVDDAAIILRAVAAGTAIAALAVLALYRFQDYSRAVFLLDAFIAVILLAGSRASLVWLRHWFATRPRGDERRVLIVGANDNGALALRLLGRSGTPRQRAVGFLDDDPGKRYRRVGGVPIVGTTADLANAIERYRPDVVLCAVDAQDHDLSPLRGTCEALGVEWRDFRVAV